MGQLLLGAGGCRDWSCRQRRQVKVELEVRLACLRARRNLNGAFARVVMVGMLVKEDWILFFHSCCTAVCKDSLTQTTFYITLVCIDSSGSD